MRYIVNTILVLYSLMSLAAGATHNVNVDVSLSQPDNSDFVATASVGGKSLDRDNPTATVEADYGDSIVVSISLTFVGEPPKDGMDDEGRLSGAALVTLDCCAGHLQVGEGAPSTQVQVATSETEWTTTKSVKVLKPPGLQESDDPDDTNLNDGGMGGGNGGGGGSLGCAACGVPGGGGLTMPVTKTSASIDIGLGTGQDGYSLGRLVFHKDSVADGQIESTNFTVKPIDAGTRAISFGGVLRQVVSNKYIVDLIDNGSGITEVLTYDISGKGAPLSGAPLTGPYSVSGTAQAIFRFTELTAAGVNGKGIKVEKLISGQETEFWILQAVDGVNGRSWRSENWKGDITYGVETVVPGTTNAQWTRSYQETIKQLSSGSEYLVSKALYEFESGPQGEVLVGITEGEGAFVRSTIYSYYGATSVEFPNGVPPAIKGKMRYSIEPDGSWTKYDYDPASGDIAVTYRPWLDLPSEPDGATLNNCRVTISGELETIHKVLGNIISTETTASASTSFKSWENSGDWITFDGETKLTELPTGAIVYAGIYSSSGGMQMSRTASSGTFQSRKLGVWNGTAFTESSSGTAVMTERGNIYRATGSEIDGMCYIPYYSTRSMTITAAGREVRSWEEACVGENEWATISNSEYTYDAKGRILTVKKNGQIEQTYSYPSQNTRVATNGYGVVTTTATSQNGAIVSTTRHGVGGALDLTNVESTSTVGLTTFNTVQTLVGANVVRTRSTKVTNDILGRRVSVEDEMGNVTKYFYPDARTIIEEDFNGNIIKTVTFLDGKVKEIVRTRGSGTTSPLASSEYHSYAVNASGLITSKVNYGNPTSIRWASSSVDGLDRTVSESEPSPDGGVITTSRTFDWAGRENSVAKTGFAKAITIYDDLAGGNASRRGIDVDGNNLLEENGDDEITDVSRPFRIDESGSLWLDEVSTTWLSEGEPETTVRSTKMGSGDKVIIDKGPLNQVTMTITSVDRVNAVVTRSVTSGGSNVPAVATYTAGALTSQTTSKNPLPTTYEYDTLGRMTAVIDPLKGRSETVYDDYDRLVTETDAQGGVTTYSYYPGNYLNPGALRSVTDPNGKTVSYAYDDQGRMTHVWGATSPVRYQYDDFGNLIKMHTYRSFDSIVSSSSVIPNGFNSPGDITEWIQDSATGLVTKKRYPDGEETTFSYNNKGLVATRTWARGVVTTYEYDGLGRLLSTAYSDGTPGVLRTYQRGSRTTTVAGASFGTKTTTSQFDSSASEGRTVESYVGGIFDNISVELTIGDQGKPMGQNVYHGQNVLISQEFQFDSRARLDGLTLSSGGKSIAAAYGYHAQNGKIFTLNIQVNGDPKIITTRSRDALGRISGVSTTNSVGQVISARTYNRNLVGQITKSTLPDGQYWEYGYDSKNQLASAAKRTSGGASVYGLGTQYVFNEIGGRASVSSAPVSPGSASRLTSYIGNSNNQYQTINNPDTLPVLGEAITGSQVTVNGIPAARQGEWFSAGLQSPNPEAPNLLPVTVGVRAIGMGVGGVDLTTSKVGSLYFAPSEEVMVYDRDGNLVSDGRWRYTWDGENRLISVQTNEAAIIAGFPVRRVEYGYDENNRRIHRSEPHWNSATSSFEADPMPTKYLWKGWSLLAEFKGEDLHKSYFWGLDIEDTLFDTGSVGNLLSIIDHSSGGAVLLPTYDANGNITALVDGLSGKLAIEYDYDAFGNKVLSRIFAEHDNPSSDVAMAVRKNRWGFSTKLEEEIGGVLYYGNRYYKPEFGGWLSRDMLGENGGLNLYGFVSNDPINSVDILGNQRYIMPTGSGEKVAGYNGWNTTTNCGCPLKIRIPSAVWNYWFVGPKSKVGVEMNIKFAFKIDKPLDKNCKCFIRVRLKQMSSRNAGVDDPEDDKGETAKGHDVGKTRLNRTTPAGFRVDWPSDDDNPPPEPFLDNHPLGGVVSKPWSRAHPDKEGTFHDTPRTSRRKQLFTAWTLFIGECLDGDLKSEKTLAVVKWGFLVKKTGRTGNEPKDADKPEYEAVPKKPEVSCDNPPGWDDASKLYNDLYGK